MSSSKVDPPESGDDPSVTSVAGPSVIRERTPDIERGMVLAGRYQIEAIIGKGGSGIVLRAFDRTAQTVVAVKVLKPELVHDERWSKRFSRELRLGRPIRHPNVCRIFDIGEGDGHRFLTMELATDGTLRDLIKRGEPLRPFDDRLKDAAAVIGGLAAIHEAGIVHRDVKPDNLLRMEDGRLAISDFGLATDLPTAAAVTVMVGTPHYMAPEVRSGEPATMRSDVWSLGVVLHEIFFGKRPEKRLSSSETFSKPPAPLTSSAIERAMLVLCERCLAEEPTERPVDARSVSRLFEAACSSPRRFAQGKRALVVAGLTVVVALAGVVARKTIHSRPSGQQSSIARIVPTGEPADWSKVATTVAVVPGHVHCFSMLGPNTARLVWNVPRVAEDVDAQSGGKKRSPLRPEAFAIGCPDLSPNGNGLLFASTNGAGAREIRLSKPGDGSDAVTLTPGFDPLWLPGGESFLYNIDAFHAAVFSLPTMTFNLISTPSGVERAPILEKAVAADKIALMFGASDNERRVAVLSSATFDLLSIFIAPAGREIRFNARGDALFISYQRSASSSTLMSVDFGKYLATNLGRYRGMDIMDVLPAVGGTAILARNRTNDIWSYEEGRWQKRTSDGESFSAAISPRGGDLLISKRTDSGVSIWRQSEAGAPQQVTTGPLDVTPDYSHDGKSWTYAAYGQRSLNLCDSETGTCKTLRRDDLLPSWPKFSPDDRRIAFITQVGSGRLNVIDLKDGTVHQLADSVPQCPPVWSRADRLWTFEKASGGYLWVERDVATGAKTGGRIEMGHTDVETALATADEVQCWPRDVAAGSPFSPRVRVQTEERASLLRLPLQL
jgi:serine/threonine-protein kinase